MESFKKLLPIIIVALVFGIGGYFIGKGVMKTQSASVYRADTMALKTGDKSPTSTGPTSGDTGPGSLAVFGGTGTPPAWMPALLCDLLGGQRRNHVTNLGGGNYQYDYTGCLFGKIVVSGNDIMDYAANIAKKNAAAKPAINETR